jgi:hypothetical protein
MIRPVSGGAMPQTEFAAPVEAGSSAAPHTPSAPDVAADHGGDPLAKLYDLIGAAPHAQTLYNKGARGGQGTQVSKTDPLVGAELPGQKGVTIKQSLGDPRGYETRNHALAWARAVGSDTAMVVLGSDKRWHAVETNKVGHDAKGGTGKVAEAIQVGKVDPIEYDRLKKLAEAKNDPEKWKDFASYALGVPRGEINVVTGNQEPSRNHVNINLTRDFNAEGRTAGFDPAKPPWVQLGPLAFDRPANACATLAHEEVHADHHRLTKPIYDRYTEYKTSHPQSKETFRQWVVSEANKIAAQNKNDPAKFFDAYRRGEIVAGELDGTFAATELEAHVEAAKVSFASGDLVQARVDLNKVASRPTLPGGQTQEVSIAVLKDLRASLTGDAAAAFDEVAKKAPPGVLRDARLQPR